MALQMVDLGILSVITLSVLTGLFRGFVKELLSLCVWISAIWLSFNYAKALDPWLSSYVHDPALRTGLACMLIFFATLLFGGLCNALLSFILKRSGLSGTDRTLGMLFGFGRAVFIVAFLMVAARVTALPYQEYAKDSKLYASFDPLVAWMYAKLPQLLKQIRAVDKSDAIIDTVPAP